MLEIATGLRYPPGGDAAERHPAGGPARPPAIICRSAAAVPSFQPGSASKSAIIRAIKTVEHFGYLAQQATIFGQHVHVGCQNGDDAIYLCCMACRALSAFIALNAASPWLDGRQRFCLFAPEPVRRLS
jgi:gamma-glutamyl:cysteine ligase YbdK (ATP-grasp superfamily)